MKSEHRHELQTNDLSKLTKKVIDVVNQHSLKIAIVICAAAVLIMAYRLYFNSVSSTQRNAWNAFAGALNTGSPEQLVGVADDKKFEGTQAADWALLLGAEARTSQAIHDMFSDRDRALTSLKRARDEFGRLVDNKDSAIQQRAIFGLAVIHESLDELDLARAEYEKLAASESSVYHDEAQARLARLKQGGAQAFYTWFMKQNPKPPEPRKPEDTGMPGPGLSLPDGQFGGGDPFAPTGPLPKPKDDPAESEEDPEKSLPFLKAPADEAQQDSEPKSNADKEGQTESDPPKEEAESAPAETPKEGETSQPDDEK